MVGTGKNVYRLLDKSGPLVVLELNGASGPMKVYKTHKDWAVCEHEQAMIELGVQADLLNEYRELLYSLFREQEDECERERDW